MTEQLERTSTRAIDVALKVLRRHEFRLLRTADGTPGDLGP